jgi:hypothetical protein
MNEVPIVGFMKHCSSTRWWLSLVPATVCSPLWAQQTPATQPPVPEPPVPVTSTALPPGKGLQWKVGDATIKIGGYVKVDLIHDFDAIGSTDSFDPRTIPTDGSDGENTRMHARQTRLNLDVNMPTSGDPMRFFVEGDFFGSGNAFRLRHAYGTNGALLAGQTWSSFMDEDGMPETLDFESPIGFPQIRQAQLRYTNKLDGGDSYAFSIEDPASVIEAPTGVDGHAEEPIPDVTANYIWKNKHGHVQVSAFGGVASFNPDVGSADTVPLWGLNLSTKFATFGDDSAIFQFTYGDGVGRYRGGTTAAPDASGNLQAVETVAVLGSYEHHWNEKYRSTVMYSWAQGDLPSGAPTTSSDLVTYACANFIWQFTDHAWAGFEYLYGTNDTFDGNDGAANRIQFSLKFSL